MDVTAPALLLEAVGTILWLGAVLRHERIRPPRWRPGRRPQREAGGLSDERLLHLGWWGGLGALLGLVLHMLQDLGPAEPTFLLWSLPLLLAMVLWWAGWRWLVPYSSRTGELLAEAGQAELTDDQRETLAELRSTRALIDGLWASLLRATLLLLPLQLVGACLTLLG